MKPVNIGQLMVQAAIADEWMRQAVVAARAAYQLADAMMEARNANR